MPLSEKTRIEVYLPDLPRPEYQDLLAALQQELTYSFGGCTTVRGLDGNYLSRAGTIVLDRVTVVYTDVPLSLRDKAESVSSYADRLRSAAFRALNEEAILVTLAGVYHSADVTSPP